MNVYDFAMKMERDGEDYYRQLAENAAVAGLRAIFSQLADDEKKHYETFKALKENATPTMTTSTALEDAKNIFESLPRNQDRVGVQDDLEAYRYAMKLESDSFRFYEDTAGRESDVGVRDLLLRIADEEQKHFNILQNIFDFVNAPNQYLAWGEFSNLDEFRNFGRG